VLPSGIAEGFLPATPGPGAVTYRPGVVGLARLHYVDRKSAIDTWQTVELLGPLDGATVSWDDAEELPEGTHTRLSTAALDGSEFEEAPAALANAGAWTDWKKALGISLYQSRPLKLFRCDTLDAFSVPGETLADFKGRLVQAGREQRDAELDSLRKRWAPKLQQLQNAVQRAQKALAEQQAQAHGQTLDTVVTVGATLLGAFLGRKMVSVTNVNRARTAMRSGSRTVKERQDVAAASQGVSAAQKQLSDAEAEFRDETEKLQSASAPDALQILEFSVAPRKSDIAVGALMLAWTPWRPGPQGVPAPASALG